MGWVDKWQPDHDLALKKHVASGYSFANAAAKINATFGTAYSRNACIGRAKRMGLSGRKTVKADGLQHRLAKKAERRAKPAPVCQPMPVPRVVDVVPLNIPLLDLEPGQCRWPLGDGPFVFCGCPQFGGASYCEPHLTLSQGLGTESERTADQGVPA